MRTYFCLSLPLLLVMLTTGVRADVVLFLGFDGMSNVLDVDDPTLPDSDPTTLGVTTSLSVFDTLDVTGNSIVNLSGGNLGGGTFLSDSATLNVLSGEANSVTMFGSPSVNVSGGRIRNLEASGTGQVNISGGEVTFGLASSIDGSVTVSGGEISGEIQVFGGSLSISGGDFVADQFSGASLSLNDGTATISGGDITPGLMLDVFGSGSQLNLIGTDFNLIVPDIDPIGATGLEMLVPVTGQLTETDFPIGDEVKLTGTLQDGSTFTVTPMISSGGTINLASVPEPSSLAVLIFAGLATSIRRRRRERTSA